LRATRINSKTSKITDVSILELLALVPANRCATHAEEHPKLLVAGCFCTRKQNLFDPTLRSGLDLPFL